MGEAGTRIMNWDWTGLSHGRSNEEPSASCQVPRHKPKTFSPYFHSDITTYWLDIVMRRANKLASLPKFSSTKSHVRIRIWTQVSHTTINWFKINPKDVGSLRYQRPPKFRFSVPWLRRASHWPINTGIYALRYIRIACCGGYDAVYLHGDTCITACACGGLASSICTMTR